MRFHAIKPAGTTVVFDSFYCCAILCWTPRIAKAWHDANFAPVIVSSPPAVLTAPPNKIAPAKGFLPAQTPLLVRPCASLPLDCRRRLA